LGEELAHAVRSLVRAAIGDFRPAGVTPVDVLGDAGHDEAGIAAAERVEAIPDQLYIVTHTLPSIVWPACYGGPAEADAGRPFTSSLLLGHVPEDRDRR